MSDPSAPFSRLKEQRSRKRCQDKQVLAQDLWASIRLHEIKLLIRFHGIKLQSIKLLNIKPHGIKSQGIMPHGERLLSISCLMRDLFLPSKMANPRLTNLSTLKGHKMWRMINTARSYLFGCRA
jgi:hypothetical protein